MNIGFVAIKEALENLRFGSAQSLTFKETEFWSRTGGLSSQGGLEIPPSSPIPVPRGCCLPGGLDYSKRGQCQPYGRLLIPLMLLGREPCTWKLFPRSLDGEWRCSAQKKGCHALRSSWGLALLGKVRGWAQVGSCSLACSRWARTSAQDVCSLPSPPPTTCHLWVPQVSGAAQAPQSTWGEGVYAVLDLSLESLERRYRFCISPSTLKCIVTL